MPKQISQDVYNRLMQYNQYGHPASATPGGSGGGASSAASAFAPGQSAMFTPDPTVGGAWTHTRADVPLFKTLPAQPPASPLGGATNKPVPPGGKGPDRFTMPVQPPAPPRPSYQRPPAPPRQTGSMPSGNWWSQMPGMQNFRKPAPQQPDPERQRRNMLADILSGT